MPRSLRLHDLSGLLNRFGQDHKDYFQRRLDEGAERIRNMYNSIVTNRNAVAHGRGSKTTFADVREFYETAHVVLDYFDQALWLRAEPSEEPVDGCPSP